jgi:hypothetical protein
MIFSRKMTIETSYSRTKVLEKLAQVVETRGCPKPKSHYKGEFVKEGFMAVTKTSAASLPHVLIFGQFIKTQTGTDVIVTIKQSRTVYVVFGVLNIILGLKFFVGLIQHSQDWALFLAFLAFLWIFFLCQFWLEVKMFKRILEPLLEESEEGKQRSSCPV